MESATMVPQLNAMYSTLQAAGFADTELLIETHPDGTHSEWYWRREFPGTYQWLFQNISTLDTSLEVEDLHYWPNPARDQVHIQNLPNGTSGWEASIFNTQGQQLHNRTLEDGQIKLSELPVGPYFILLQSKNGHWALIHLSKI